MDRRSRRGQGRAVPANWRRPVISNHDIFAALHVPGDPVVLYNIWDAGSAIAVAAAGAKALATGSHPVGDA
ncbi:MAG: isocitrate lyase/phosphoenolpyruvate mutase family protein, partial [Sphingomicrobium sp.]